MSRSAMVDARCSLDDEPREPPRALPLGLRTHRPYLTPEAAVNPEHVLGPALIEAVRQVVRGELQTRLASDTSPARSPWMTPPTAARVTGVPVKTIRAWARVGRIAKRLKNRSADPKQQKYLVHVDDVVTVAEQACTAADAGKTVDVKQRAQARAQEILAARAAKGR